MFKYQDLGPTGVPAKGARLIHRHLIELGSRVPPRVQAAVFRTLWNSWVTERRFQRRRTVKNVCVFKCSITAEDSLEHYCRCPVVLRVGRNSLRIDYPPQEGLNIWTLNSYWVEREDIMCRLAILVYGTYTAFNSIKHKGISDSQQAHECIVQSCRQGVVGSDKCTQLWDNSWSLPILYYY